MTDTVFGLRGMPCQLYTTLISDVKGAQRSGSCAESHAGAHVWGVGVAPIQPAGVNYVARFHRECATPLNHACPCVGEAPLTEVLDLGQLQV